MRVKIQHNRLDFEYYPFQASSLQTKPNLMACEIESIDLENYPYKAYIRNSEIIFIEAEKTLIQDFAQQNQIALEKLEDVWRLISHPITKDFNSSLFHESEKLKEWDIEPQIQNTLRFLLRMLFEENSNSSNAITHSLYSILIMGTNFPPFQEIKDHFYWMCMSVATSNLIKYKMLA